MEEYLMEGFQIRGDRERPPKLKLGDGMKFYTNTKFGDLTLLGKLLINGTPIREAMEVSGVKRHRSFRLARFLQSKYSNIKIDLSPVRKFQKQYDKQCSQCKKSFTAHRKDQVICSPECKNTYFVEYQRVYNKTRRNTSCHV